MDSRTYGRYLGQVIVTVLTVGVVLIVAAATLAMVDLLMGAC